MSEFNVKYKTRFKGKEKQKWIKMNKPDLLSVYIGHILY